MTTNYAAFFVERHASFVARFAVVLWYATIGPENFSIPHVTTSPPFFLCGSNKERNFFAVSHVISSSFIDTIMVSSKSYRHDCGF